MSLMTFAEQLERHMPKPDPGVRPFVCDGSPLDCPVFVVGSNPATQMPFRQYWKPDEGGFQKRKFMNDYLQKGRTKLHPTITRARLALIGENVRTIETNIYPMASKERASLKPEYRNTEIFRFLFRTLKPTLVWAHGADAQRFFSDELRCESWKEGELNEAEWQNHPFWLLVTPHLSRRVRDDQVREWARLVSNQCAR